eukprot:Sspe_Gene.1198::Locus_405_Transcript_1_3_Confidence_0.714_Length_7052::g.1198::m.1198
MCKLQDTSYAPPAEPLPGAIPTVPESKVALEMLPVQYPVRVLDYSTQSVPGNVLQLVGPPDATERYFQEDAPNKGKSWEPLQVVCERKPKKRACMNEEWRNALQYVVLEYAEPIYLSQIHVYENSHPGSVVEVQAQPAPKGARAAPGGGAPVTEVLANGTVVTEPVKAGKTKVDASVLNNTSPRTPRRLRTRRTGCRRSTPTQRRSSRCGSARTPSSTGSRWPASTPRQRKRIRSPTLKHWWP